MVCIMKGLFLLWKYYIFMIINYSLGLNNVLNYLCEIEIFVFFIYIICWYVVGYYVIFFCDFFDVI